MTTGPLDTSLDSTLDSGTLETENIDEVDPAAEVMTEAVVGSETYGLPTDQSILDKIEREVEEEYYPGTKAFTETAYEYANGVVSAQPMEWGPGGIMPVDGPVSSSWTGGRRATGGHGGVDFSVPIGTPVRAPANGVVENVNNLGNRSYGLYVTIRHPDGSLSYYAHLSGANVRPGQTVTAGTVIGASGSSGNSSGPHLHFEVRPGAGQQASPGGTIDPMAWLNTQPGSGSVPSTPYSGGALNYNQLKSTAMQAGFNNYDAGIMAAIALGESGGVPTAYNPVGVDDSYGLWQINLRYGPAEIARRLRIGGAGSRQALFDPLVNARTAFALFREQGFRAWTIYNNGEWRKHYRG